MFKRLDCGDGLQEMDLEPFRMSVHNEQKHVAHEGSSEIEVQSDSWLRWSFPKVKGSNVNGRPRCRARLLAH